MQELVCLFKNTLQEKLKELVATRFDNIVGGCYDKNLEEYIICKKVAMTD